MNLKSIIVGWKIKTPWFIRGSVVTGIQGERMKNSGFDYFMEFYYCPCQIWIIQTQPEWCIFYWDSFIAILIFSSIQKAIVILFIVGIRWHMQFTAKLFQKIFFASWIPLKNKCQMGIGKTGWINGFLQLLLVSVRNYSPGPGAWAGCEFNLKWRFWYFII